MWQEAKANDKRIKEAMAEHKKRAERRRAYYNSKLGDPRQLLRIIGSTVKLYPNGEQYYYHENTDNLMPWQGDATVKIDRFDGRSLLDFIPQNTLSRTTMNDEEASDREELCFERYRDLVETDRLHVSEKERLEFVDEEWIKLLDRHKALMAMVNPTKKKLNAVGFDYGSSTSAATIDSPSEEQESDLLNEVDILKYVNNLSEKDRQILNDMGKKYGIRNYVRLLRIAKRERDQELDQLKAKQQSRQGNTKEDGGKSKQKRRRRRSRWDKDSEGFMRHRRRRKSPSYGETYSDDQSGASDEDYDSSDDDKPVVVIEFGSESADRHQHLSVEERQPMKESVSDAELKSTSNAASASATSKKLTPMEKLKLKMRAGLEKTIQSDEKLLKEQVLPYREVDRIAPIVSSVNVTTLSHTTTNQPIARTRYRSPSSSRSPSPSASKKQHSQPSDATRKYSLDSTNSKPLESRNSRPRSRSPSSSSYHRRRRSPTSQHHRRTRDSSDSSSRHSYSHHDRTKDNLKRQPRSNSRTHSPKRYRRRS